MAGIVAAVKGVATAILAIVTGPVGITVLILAAVVALVIAFRKPIGDFFNWLGSAIMDGIKVIYKAGEPIRKFWSGVWESAKKLATDFVSWIGKAWQSIGRLFQDYVVKPLGNAWKAVINTGKQAVRGFLQYLASRINTVAGLINRLISAYNRLPAPNIPVIPQLTVPAFAKGGYVGGGTLALVGEAGPEYIIPERKMAQASMNYLNGARGGAVIPAYAQGGYVGGSAQINVTTGPVMQQGGQQYVSMADLERAMRKTADGIYASLRTPAGRYAVGVR
jgi:hypothetical protein